MQGDYSDHIVMCGWNKNGPSIVRQLHSEVVKDKRLILIITKEDIDLSDLNDSLVQLIKGEPFDRGVLRSANIEDAQAAIILADPEERDNPDAKSILVALTIEEINPEVYTCVELRDSKNKVHFGRTRVDELVSESELTEKLLSQSVLTSRITSFYTELLTFQREGSEIYKVKPAEEHYGQTFHDLFLKLLDDRITLIGIGSEEKVLNINPGPDYRIKESDDLVVIALQEPEFKR